MLKKAGSRSIKIICVFKKPTKFVEKNEIYGSASRLMGLMSDLRLTSKNLFSKELTLCLPEIMPLISSS